MRPTLLRLLRPVDALILGFALFLTALNCGFAGRIPTWWVLVIVNALVSGVIVSMVIITERSRNRLLHIIRDWYPAPLTFIVFKEIHVIIQSIGPRDYDTLFIAIDRWLFGVDPTVWMSRFITPALTEILQIAYASYFVIITGVAYAFYRRNEMVLFSYYVFVLLCGFFFSYIGYLLLPGIGPRFTLHEFSRLDEELPGLFISTVVRDLINAAESIPKGIPNAEVVAQRDVFPSGHTQMTIIAVYMAFRHRLPSRYVFFTLGALLIVATVYLRYHYVIDIIAGAVCAALTIAVAPALNRWWLRISSAEEMPDAAAAPRTTRDTSAG